MAKDIKLKLIILYLFITFLHVVQLF